jgi:hypothetical protein
VADALRLLLHCRQWVALLLRIVQQLLHNQSDTCDYTNARILRSAACEDRLCA